MRRGYTGIYDPPQSIWKEVLCPDLIRLALVLASRSEPCSIVRRYRPRPIPNVSQVELVDPRTRSFHGTWVTSDCRRGAKTIKSSSAASAVLMVAALAGHNEQGAFAWWSWSFRVTLYINWKVSMLCYEDLRYNRLLSGERWFSCKAFYPVSDGPPASMSLSSSNLS